VTKGGEKRGIASPVYHQLRDPPLPSCAKNSNQRNMVYGRPMSAERLIFGDRHNSPRRRSGNRCRWTKPSRRALFIVAQPQCITGRRDMRVDVYWAMHGERLVITPFSAPVPRILVFSSVCTCYVLPSGVITGCAVAPALC